MYIIASRWILEARRVIAAMQIAAACIMYEITQWKVLKVASFILSLSIPIQCFSAVKLYH